MKILFCGSSGFIGRHISSVLESGHAITPFNVADGNDMQDYARVKEAVYGKDIVLHFGAAAVGREGIEKMERGISIEITGTEHFARAAAFEGIPLVYASSIRVYGTQAEMEGGEIYLTNPTHAYGRMKIECEKILHSYGQNQGLRFAVLRMAAAYGEGMPDGSVVASFLHSILSSKQIKLLTHGKTKRNFIYVKDIARVMSNIVEHWRFHSNEIFNIAQRETVTLSELSHMIGVVTGKKFSVEEGFESDGISEEQISIKKAEHLLGWNALTSLHNGLKLTYESL